MDMDWKTRQSNDNSSSETLSLVPSKVDPSLLARFLDKIRASYPGQIKADEEWAEYGEMLQELCVTFGAEAVLDSFVRQRMDSEFIPHPSVLKNDLLFQRDENRRREAEERAQEVMESKFVQIPADTDETCTMAAIYREWQDRKAAKGKP